MNDFKECVEKQVRKIIRENVNNFYISEMVEMISINLEEKFRKNKTKRKFKSEIKMCILEMVYDGDVHVADNYRLVEPRKVSLKDD